MNLKNIRYIVCLIIEFLSSALTQESVKTCLADQRGGLILPIDGMEIGDNDWIKYKSLKKDKSLKALNTIDLPSDFCQKACDLVDEFRRKTVNEDVEWMLYFDYRTGDVIYCWEGEEGKSGGDYDDFHFNSRTIASVHNHIKGYYSFPSPENFDILENDFEDYEIITSINAFWTVEFKGSVGKTVREKFQLNLSIEFEKMEMEIKFRHVNMLMIRHMSEILFSDYLLNDIDKCVEGIPLVFNKKEYD